MASHTSHTSHTRHTQPYGHGGAAIWYRVRADLRGRRVQTGSVVLIVALSTLLIGLGLIVFGSVQAPFDSLFTQLNGAHVWLTTSPQAQFTQAQLTAIRDAPNVIATTDLEEAAQGYILLGPSKLRANLMSYPAQQPSIGQLGMTQGKGLSTSDPGGVIIDQAFATTHDLRVGETLTLVTANGQEQVHVRGVAVDVNHDSQSDGTVCQIHLVRATLDSFYPPSQLYGLIGVQIADPIDSKLS